MYRRLAGAIREAIERGEIRAGERLPSERALAAKPSPSPARRSSRPTRSCAGTAPSRAAGAAARGCAAPPPRPPALLLREDPSGSFRRHPVWRSFIGRAGRNDRISRRAPARARRARAGGRAHRREGDARARAGPRLPARWDCRRCARRSRSISRRRGVATSEDQVLVTHGAQQAIGLAGALLLERGETVVVEDPTYLGLDRHLRRAGRAPRHRAGRRRRGVGRRGCARPWRATSPRLVYLMPTFQNPTGAVMPETCRRALARMSARAAGCRSSRTTRSRTWR